MLTRYHDTDFEQRALFWMQLTESVGGLRGVDCTLHQLFKTETLTPERAFLAKLHNMSCTSMHISPKYATLTKLYYCL